MTPGKFLAKTGHWKQLATKWVWKRPLDFYPGTPKFYFSFLLTSQRPGLLPQDPPGLLRAGGED